MVVTGSPSDDGIDDNDFLGSVVRASENNELLDDLDNDSFDGLQLDFKNDLSIFGNYAADFNWGVDTDMDTQPIVPGTRDTATPPPTRLREQANGNASNNNSPAPSRTDTIYYSAPGTPIQGKQLPSPIAANSNSTSTSFQSKNNSNPGLLTPLPSQSSIPSLLQKSDSWYVKLFMITIRLPQSLKISSFNVLKRSITVLVMEQVVVLQVVMEMVMRVMICSL
ncbi:unnamed protein product [Ambrosiozyma monospora]|uniref:Unnamed protein product n=1 Tax=Ambrosiozyma monospora TaxID=43982 RepID=A0ACB5UAK9_AMBMO|nr:unnamed protein product [Ambrosiozyma monospora]